MTLESAAPLEPLEPLEPNSPRHTLGRFLDDVAERHGERCAIRFEGDSLRYADVRSEARRLARALIGAGVGKGSRVRK